MDYKKTLTYLYHLNDLANKFSYLNKNLDYFMTEKKNKENYLDWCKKQWFTKIFKNRFYHDQLLEAKIGLERVESVISLLQANPNKEQEKNITLKEIVDSSIAKTTKHLTPEEIEQINRNMSARSFIRTGYRLVSINASPELVFFEDKEPVKKEEPALNKDFQTIQNKEADKEQIF